MQRLSTKYFLDESMSLTGSFSRVSNIILLCISGIILTACGSTPPHSGSAENPRPNVVIIVMDTARQDTLSCYGYPEDTTPNLRALLTASRLYKEAYSVTCWTAPAHASLFTGLYPVAHGTTQEDWKLKNNMVTLAEILAREGYETVGIVENPMISKANNFNQGFLEYHETWRMRRRPGQHDGDLVLNQFRRSLARIGPSTPFLLFVNLVEPHNPYNSSAQFINTFVTDPSITITQHQMIPYYLGKKDYSEKEFRHLKELYDAEILMVDYLIGKMIDALKATGNWDHTILIVTSDHGENIGDHGHVGHYFSVTETTIKIPLIIRYPSLFAPGSIDHDPTQLTDILPTILDALGIDDPVSQGVSLLDLDARGERPVLCEYYRPLQVLQLFGKHRNNPALLKYDRSLRALIHNKRKLVWGSDGRHEMYDLAKDPGESRNLIDVPEYSEDKEVLLAMMQALVRYYHRETTRDAGPAKDKMDEATLDALRSLGYIN